MSGESGDVNEETVTAWRERLVTLMHGYSPEDIWNEDKTGCFFRALPDKTPANAKEDLQGRKECQELHHCYGSILCKCCGRERSANIIIVIGKSASPWCFKGIKDKKKPLGVPYYANTKAWMDSVIMLDILNQLNQKFARQEKSDSVSGRQLTLSRCCW